MVYRCWEKIEVILSQYCRAVPCCLFGLLQREEQVVKVLSSEKRAGCEYCQGARRGDLLEIEYTGKLEDGKVFDGSSIKVRHTLLFVYIFVDLLLSIL